MAFVSMGSTHVIGGVAGQDIIEGRAVAISQSGLHNDLPTVLYAASGSVGNVYVAICPPDQFSRPTWKGFFSRPSTTTFLTNDAPYDTNLEEFLVDSGQRGPAYLISPSLLTEPTVFSGWMVQLHQGGAYSLTTNDFVDSANIRVPGAPIQVGANGKFQYHASASIVGRVREYRDGKLVIVLDQRSA